jgi:hypothetical protein
MLKSLFDSDPQQSQRYLSLNSESSICFLSTTENSIFALHRVSSNNDMTAPQTQLHPLYSADYTHCNSAIVPLVEQAIMKCGYDLNLVC